MSPRRQPTPEQRRVTPLQWLSEGVDDNDAIPSLNEVRVALFKQEKDAKSMFSTDRRGDNNPKRSVSAKSATAQS